MSNIQGKDFITGLIRNYYKTQNTIAPDKIEQREFGFGTFDNKVAFRHVSFKSETDLKKYLTENAPAFVDCSVAYYRAPDARPMDKKIWLGSELGFDIDTTDIPTDCKLEHGKEWVCEKCLEAAKTETIKLIENFLIADFGLSEKDIETNFSGNRGYHVHVRSSDILKFDANARSEVSSYIKGSGIVIKNMFPGLGERGKQLLGPRLSDKGWYGRIARGFISLLDCEADLLAIGLDNRLARRLHEKRALIELGISNGNWDMIRIPKKTSVIIQVINKLISSGCARIDENVTKDPSHLMRLPNTIHGGSGLIAKRINSKIALEKFDPMKDAIAFKSSDIKVKANTKYSVTMNQEEFGPFNNEIVTLPVYVATYLYLKGLADIVSS